MGIETVQQPQHGFSDDAKRIPQEIAVSYLSACGLRRGRLRRRVVARAIGEFTDPRRSREGLLARTPDFRRLYELIDDALGAELGLGADGSSNARCSARLACRSLAPMLRRDDGGSKLLAPAQAVVPFGVPARQPVRMPVQDLTVWTPRRMLRALSSRFRLRMAPRSSITAARDRR